MAFYSPETAKYGAETKWQKSILILQRRWVTLPLTFHPPPKRISSSQNSQAKSTPEHA
jgi:hypothetical protein